MRGKVSRKTFLLLSGSFWLLGGRLEPVATGKRPSACAAEAEVMRTAYWAENEGSERWDRVVPLIEHAWRCLGEGITPMHAEVLTYESSVYVRMGRLTDALAALDRFFTAYEGGAKIRYIAVMHRRRGYVYERLGRTAERLREYALAATYADRLPLESAVNTLLDVGEQYVATNDYQSAARHYSAAESLLVRSRHQRSPRYAALLGYARARIARNLADIGLLSDADRLDPRADSLFDIALQQIPDAEWERRLPALLDRAYALAFYNRPAEALPLLQEAHPLAYRMDQRDPNLVFRRWTLEGLSRLKLGQFARARRAYDEALYHAQRSGDARLRFHALANLGFLHLRMAEQSGEGDYREAEAYYRAAIAAASELRRRLGLQDWTVGAWEDVQSPYRGLVHVLLHQGRAAEAFQILDDTRARHLRNLRAATRLQAQLSESARAQADSLLGALRGLRHRLGTPGLAPTDRGAIEAEISYTHAQVERLLGGSVAEQPLDLTALQRVLRERRQVVLSYLFIEEEGWVFVVRPDTLAAIRLHADGRAVRRALEATGSVWEGRMPDPGFDANTLHHLYRLLIEPVQRLLPQGVGLVIIPEGPIAALPFGMLLTAPPTPTERFAYHRLPFLIRRHAVSAELAAALLLESVPIPDEYPLDLLALGRSRFGGERRTDVRGSASAPLEDLPNVPEEIARVTRRGGRSLAAVDHRATEVFLADHLGAARIVHLASHAVVNPAAPLYSYVVLSDTPDPDDDGLLYLHELQGRPLGAELVVLSGCETAWGPQSLGEGALGLQYAFRGAGARATLATLWQADDHASVDLMDRFYSHLRRGLPKDRALQQAQLDFLETREGMEASPFFWAALMLYGDPGPLPSSRSWGGWIALALGLGIASLVVVYWLRVPAHRHVSN